MNALAEAPLPYHVRALSRKELLRNDIYSFASPKMRRLVRVAGPLCLGQALLLEFDPCVRAYVERPRLLTCGKAIYEIDFWQVESTGRERMTMVVPSKNGVAAEGGRRRHRLAIQLLDAAAQANIPLEFVQEAELLQKSDAVRNAFRMLPSVQLAHRLTNRLAYREQILQVLGQFECLRIEHIESNLDRLPQCDIRCVVADLIHDGQINPVDSGELRPTSRVRRSAP